MAREPRPDEAHLFEEVYIDETSQSGHRFLILGGIIIPRRLSQQFEKEIIEARWPRLAVYLHVDRRSAEMKLTEIGWNSISKGDFPKYKKVVDAYFGFARKHLGRLENCKFYCSVVDTHVPGRRYSGGERGQVGFDREIYFHCMSIARVHKDGLFHVYPDFRTTNHTMDRMKRILDAGIRKDARLGKRSVPFRRVQFRQSHDVQALQISDLLIGAVAYRLNGHYNRPGGADKKFLCEYILTKGQFWKHISATGFRDKPFGQFQVWFRRHKS